MIRLHDSGPAERQGGDRWGGRVRPLLRAEAPGEGHPLPGPGSLGGAGRARPHGPGGRLPPRPRVPGAPHRLSRSAAGARLQGPAPQAVPARRAGADGRQAPPRFGPVPPALDAAGHAARSGRLPGRQEGRRPLPRPRPPRISGGDLDAARDVFPGGAAGLRLQPGDDRFVLPPVLWRDLPGDGSSPRRAACWNSSSACSARDEPLSPRLAWA